jgi:osmotically-inducible protein OsmY
MKSDLQLQRDVIAELEWDPTVSASVGVEVKKGVVTLSGHVSTLDSRCHAEQAARHVYGVQQLDNQIDVTLAGATRRTDGDIARTALDLLQWTTDVSQNAVGVTVDNATITLSGTVDWDYQRQDAAESIRRIIGIRSVVNLIEVRPKSTSPVTPDIEAALSRRAKTGGTHVNVAVAGSVVTLSGCVRSVSERDLSRAAAWAAPGVTHVVDDIVVAN